MLKALANFDVCHVLLVQSQNEVPQKIGVLD